MYMIKFAKISITIIACLSLSISSALAQVNNQPVELNNVLDVVEYLDELGQEEAEQDFLPPKNLPEAEYFRAKVLRILSDETEILPGGFTSETQKLEMRILNGSEKGKVLEVINGGINSLDKYKKARAGETLILLKVYSVNGADYYVDDYYRIPYLFVIALLFAVLAIIFGRWKGVGSLLGLGFSILVLALFIVPQIAGGVNPLLVSIVGTLIIAGVSLFLAHGFNKRTLLSFVSTMITLVIALGLSEIFIRVSYLFGKGSEEAYFLQFGSLANVDLRGLLLSGIVIGTLGVLDDITTAQTAVVGELKRANPSLSIKELYSRGLVVGREHISSLVNTLVLAYAGASMPLFLLFGINERVPIWLKLNGELMAEEIVRTLIGSIALILAVPISTLLAARFLGKEKNPPKHFHAH